MMNKVLLPSIFVILFILLGSHLIALSSFWYWRYWWFDNLMHFLGGFSISLVILYYSHRFKVLSSTSKISFLFSAIAIVFFPVIFWEVFEFSTGITFPSPDYFFDTVSDILMGLFGSWVGALYVFSIFNQRVKKT